MPNRPQDPCRAPWKRKESPGGGPNSPKCSYTNGGKGVLFLALLRTWYELVEIPMVFMTFLILQKGQRAPGQSGGVIQEWRKRGDMLMGLGPQAGRKGRYTAGWFRPESGPSR